ncbi:MAG: SusC/RagA family TonB-linked outer membrane protein [Bacteroidales bacterium]
MRQKFIYLTFLLLLCATEIFAQTHTLKGVVKDSHGEPLIGATVLLIGTGHGTATDYDGNYELADLPAEGMLRFSSIGMKTIEVAIPKGSVLDIVMHDDTEQLEEVVVVGYGTAKLKDLTSPIANIKGDEISKSSSSNAMQAIQGKVAGVQVVSNGEPGAGPAVRIRGVGSFTNESPLYVVDGMFYDNINFLNSNDIEDISVLKDASAAAIYGVRAANGVVLVTTKKGSFAQQAKVSYNGYVGLQHATNMLKMADGSQYTMMLQEVGGAQNQAILDKAAQLWGANPDGTPSTNTNWYKELTRPAFMQNHSVDVTGGTEKAAYTVGLSYLDQDGIMNAKSDFNRFTMRTKGDYKPFDWLKIGTNVILSKSTKNAANNDAWYKAFTAPAIVPVYDPENSRNEEGFSDMGLAGFNNGFFANPIASAHYYSAKNEILQVLPSIYAEVSILPNKLSFKTTYNQEFNLDRFLGYTPSYQVSDIQKNDVSMLVKQYTFSNNFIWDNILTYTDSKDKHSWNVMLGQSLRQENVRWMKGTAEDVDMDKPEWGYIDKGTNTKAFDGGATYNGLSFFGRGTYNYDSKYLLSLTMRADASSKYNEKWGYFPSVGLGWVASEESFMKNQKVFDFLKARASWGLLGNDKVDASAGFAGILTGVGNSGAFGDILVPGFINQNTFSWLKWEVVEEINAGIEATFLANRLRLEADYYSRTTHDAVVACPMPITGEMVNGNYGKIRNSGFELNLNWSDNIGKDFSYNVGFNMTTLKNEVLSLKDGVPYLYTNSAEFRTIIKPGEAINSYYGLKVLGVYQNQAQIEADPIAKANALVPGDFIYQDLNGDGQINDDDRQILGNKLPKFTYGANVGMSWKNMDFSMNFSGVAGNHIVNQKRGIRRFAGNVNYDANLVENRWHGEGTSNSYPSAAGMVKDWNIGKFNSFLVEKGNYFRVQNIQLGYTFENIARQNKKGPALRLYVNADNPFTFFKYNGFTPEIGSGFDTTTYPMASTYTFGVRLTY